MPKSVSPTRHRPTKSEEIDLFSGLLFCGDCGYKMYLQKGAGTPERKHAYTCGNYRNRARNDFLCTTHYIRKTIPKKLVLADLQWVLAYVKEHEQEFIRTAAEYRKQAAKKALAQQRKELDKTERRMDELNLLFRKLYEDMALGRLSSEQFALLTSGYEDEKAALAKRATELRQEIDSTVECGADVKRFVALVRRYSKISELTYENIHEFIDRILVHELDRETNTRKIEIFYSLSGLEDEFGRNTVPAQFISDVNPQVKGFVPRTL